MLLLTLTAELTGVTDLLPVDTPENPYYYTFKVQCTRCRETHDKWVGMSRHESNDISGSRGDAHFVWRCKNCKSEHSASVKEGPFTYVADESGKKKRQKVLEIDNRGLEFVEFRADGTWQASSSENSTKFADVDLSEGDWYDYDEKAGEEVSIKDLVWELRRAV